MIMSGMGCVTSLIVHVKSHRCNSTESKSALVWTIYEHEKSQFARCIVTFLHLYMNIEVLDKCTCNESLKQSPRLNTFLINFITNNYIVNSVEPLYFVYDFYSTFTAYEVFTSQHIRYAIAYRYYADFLFHPTLHTIYILSESVLSYI